MRAKCKRWQWRAIKAEGELEELRMRLHQFAACKDDAKETARGFLCAEAIAYHNRLKEATH